LSSLYSLVGFLVAGSYISDIHHNSSRGIRLGMFARTTKYFLKPSQARRAVWSMVYSPTSASLGRGLSTRIENDESIGFIGLGRMGYPMALNILNKFQKNLNDTAAKQPDRKRNVNVFLYDVEPERAVELIKEFNMSNKDISSDNRVVPVEANSVAHLSSNSATIITMLPNTSHVFDTMTRIDGVFNSAKKGRPLFCSSSLSLLRLESLTTPVTSTYNVRHSGALLVDCSTIDPIASKALHNIAKDDFTLNFYDCPVR
jgi:3-hydroxyisobutyrate dehydrogenase-like beta-hydroxyacid dehydrogenase